MTDTPQILEEMNDRSREVFRRVVEGYLHNGDPVGSNVGPEVVGDADASQRPV